MTVIRSVFLQIVMNYPHLLTTSHGMLPFAYVHVYVHSPCVLPQATWCARKKNKQGPQCSPSPMVAGARAWEALKHGIFKGQLNSKFRPLEKTFSYSLLKKKARCKIRQLKYTHRCRKRSAKICDFETEIEKSTAIEVMLQPSSERPDGQ